YTALKSWMASHPYEAVPPCASLSDSPPGYPAHIKYPAAVLPAGKPDFPALPSGKHQNLFPPRPATRYKRWLSVLLLRRILLSRHSIHKEFPPAGYNFSKPHFPDDPPSRS